MSSKVICICTQISACGDTLQHVYCLFNILASSFSAGQIFKKVSLAGQFIGTEYHIPKYWIDSYCLNVRFLASFITEAGILLKRSKTGISVKAHRKIAMGIKTARAFGGLMPFTTMGTKHFVFGRTMEDLDADYEYKMYDPNFVNWEPSLSLKRYYSFN